MGPLRKEELGKLYLGTELEAGRWLKTWEVEKGRRMGKQSGEKG